MAQVELTMPEVGESIVEGLVVEWLKQPGDTVDVDEPIASYDQTMPPWVMSPVFVASTHTSQPLRIPWNGSWVKFT